MFKLVFFSRDIVQPVQHIVVTISSVAHLFTGIPAYAIIRERLVDLLSIVRFVFFFRILLDRTHVEKLAILALQVVIGEPRRCLLAVISVGGCPSFLGRRSPAFSHIFTALHNKDSLPDELLYLINKLQE